MADDPRIGRPQFMILEELAWQHANKSRKNVPKDEKRDHAALWGELSFEVRSPLAAALTVWEDAWKELKKERKKNSSQSPPKPELLKSIREWVKKNQDEVLPRYEPYIQALEDLLEQQQLARDAESAVEYLELETELVRNGYESLTKTLVRNAERVHNISNKRRMKVGKMSEEAGWTWVSRLGAGGYGTAHAYVLQSSQGMIIDSLVAKDAELQSSKVRRSTWNKDKTIPNETAAMLALRPLKGSDRIVKLRNWRTARRTDLGKIYRVYMEFCGLGGLDDLMMKYRAVYDEADNFIKRQFIPEPFVWKCFEDLVTAGLLMERGDLVPNPRSCDLIVHRDWRTANVFLGTNESGLYAAYPTVKTGYFGLTAVIPGQNPEAPEYYHTFKWAHGAPEENGKELLSSKTNVWACGHVVYGAITLFDEDGGYKASHANHTSFDDEVKAHYSKELLELVMSCLVMNPSDRPSFDKLLKKVKRHTRAWMRNLARGLRYAPENHPGFVRHSLLGLKESWPLRSMLDDDSRPPPKTRSSDTSDEVKDTLSSSGEDDDEDGAGDAGGGGGGGNEDQGEDDHEHDDGDDDEDGDAANSKNRSAGAGAERSTRPRREPPKKRGVKGKGPQTPKEDAPKAAKTGLKIKLGPKAQAAPKDVPKAPAGRLILKPPRKPKMPTPTAMDGARAE